MNTLLIDTHDRELLLAIYKDEKLKWKKEIKEQLDHSTVCMPSLVALLNEASLTIHDINDIVVVNGPGSFTGVRLGVTIAKILSYTLQIPIRSITSLELYEYPSDAIYGVLKEKNGYTDLDFFSSTFEAADLMDKVHGQPLVGRPRGMGLIEDYNWFNEESGELEQWNMCLSLLTEQDLKVMRISDLKLLGEFNSLFYEQPATCVPEKWFGWDGANALINDGRIYTINIRVGTLGSAKFAYEKTGDYHLSNIMTKKSQLCPLLFDEKVGMFCTVTENGADIIYLESDSQSKFPDAYPDYNLIYAGLLDEGGLWDPGKGYAVMEHKTDKSRMVLHFDLLCLDKDWGGDDAFKNRIIEQDKIVSTSNLSSATCFGMNRISKMLYFSKEDKLYYYDLENKREFEVKRLNGETAVPAGEHIVMIKHVVFNCSYPEEAIEEYLSKLAVATSDGTDYKIYLFDIVSDKLQTEPTVFAGNGIPAEIIYMSSYMGNAYWCY